MSRWCSITLALVLYIHLSYPLCTGEGIAERCFYENTYEINNNKFKLQRYNDERSRCIIKWKFQCSREKRILLNLTRVDHLSYYQYITIFDSNIPEIKINSFRNMSNLIKINITASNVQNVEFGGFIGVSKLKLLFLNNNSITNITKGLFNHLSNLIMLDLSMNKINHIEEGSFLGVHIQEMYISHNEIQDLSPLMENCQDMIILDISYNKISSLELIENCTKLLVLNAANNRLMKLSPYLFQQLPLEILDLSSNLLNDLDIDTFKGLDNLYTLDLTRNKINNGQPIIGLFQHNHNLHILNLSSNSITNLQLGLFSKLTNLQILNVSNNELTNIPQEMFHDLESLLSLYINNNLLTTFNGPKLFGEINIDGNPWNCQQLSRIVAFYKNVMIPGTSHNTSSISGISCKISNKIIDPINNNYLSESDKIGFATGLGEFLEVLKLNMKNTSKEMQILIETNNQNQKALLEEFQNNNNVNQNIFSSIQQNSSNTLKEFLKVIAKQSENSSNILKEIPSQNNHNIVKQTDEHDSTKLILKQFSQNVEQQFEKLLSIFNNTLLEKDYTHKQEMVQSEKLGGNIVVPRENSNIFVGVLIVLIVFLIAFCLTVFYFIRSIKIHHKIREIDEIQL